MLPGIPIYNRRSDSETRMAVQQAIDLHHKGDLMNALRLLVERDVPKPIIVRTLLSDDSPAS